MKRIYSLYLFSSLAISFSLYARSLSYDFVYDDHWRIVTNEAIKNFSNIPRFFTDTTTQASHPGLHKDNYRPIANLYFSAGHFLWGLSPQGYRATNIFLHAINGFCVGFLGFTLLHLSPLSALMGLFYFLIHPLHVESVVWVVEATNLLGTSFILVGLTSWIQYRQSEKKKWAALTYSLFILGLLTRETVVCFPVLIVGVDFLLKKTMIHERKTEPKWNHYFGMMGLSCSYIFLRSLLIGQLGITPFWGGTLMTNIENVLQTILVYAELILYPNSLRLTYADLPLATGFFNLKVLGGIFLLFAICLGGILSFRKKPNITFCLLGIVLFWLPGSNIVPITTLFAERFTYPMLIFCAWLIALGFDFVSRLGVRSGLKKILITFFLVYCGWMITICFYQIPVWRNDLTLWENAVKKAPNNWFAWACLAQEEKNRADILEKQTKKSLSIEFLKRAENSFTRSLKIGAPMDSAGLLFYHLAHIKEKNAEFKESRELLSRAFQLRPDLEARWNARNQVDVVDSSP